MMRIKFEIIDIDSEGQEEQLELDMIVNSNMTVSKLSSKLEILPQTVDQVLVNGNPVSKYYALDPQDCITFISGSGESKKQRLTNSN
ncbi:MAG: hypothetical protein ACQEQI_08485 [Bacillota bacterium]